MISASLLVRADRAVVVLLAVTSGAGATAMLLIGPLGDAPARRRRPAQSGWPCVGWAADVAASAAVTPSGSLAAVRRQQRTVLLVRAAESAVSIGAVGVLLLVDADVMVVPVVLAVVAAASGVAAVARISSRRAG